MDVGSHMSEILDGSGVSNGLDIPSALRASTNLLSKISNTEMISSALVGAANRVFDNDQKKVEAEVFGDLSLASGLVQLAATAGHRNKMAFEATGMSWTVGTIIAIAGYGFVLGFIACPACEQRWFWKALLYAEMYGPLFKDSACPGCKRDFDQRDDAAGSGQQ